MGLTLANNLVYKAREDVLLSELQDEAVLLSLKNGKYFGLNIVGLSIWKIVQAPTGFSQIIDSLVEEYEVGRDECAAEAEPFVEKLLAEGLLEVVG